ALSAGTGDGGDVVAQLLGALDASVAVGPMTLVGQGFGLRASLTSGDASDALARFGGLGLDIGFLPPTGVGIAIDVEGILSGGGFLTIDTAAGRYAGIAALEML